jgi:hypothetical protein
MLCRVAAGDISACCMPAMCMLYRVWMHHHGSCMAQLCCKGT